MKKILFLLLSICMIQRAQAQFGGGFSGIVYDPTNYAAALDQISKSTIQIEQLSEQIQWMVETKDQLTDIWQMQEDIRQRLYRLNGLENLQWNEMQSLFEQAILMGSDSRNYFRYKIPHLGEFSRLLQSGGEPADARNLYEFFYEKSTAYDPAKSITELLTHQATQAEKRYAAETFSQKQKMQMAMGYMKEADQQAIKAEELRQKVIQEGAVSMSEGERALVLNAANHTMLQSMKMREEANRLYTEALQKGPAQRLLDWQQRTAMLRSTKARLLPMILPGA